MLKKWFAVYLVVLFVGFSGIASFMISKEMRAQGDPLMFNAQNLQPEPTVPTDQPDETETESAPDVAEEQAGAGEEEGDVKGVSTEAEADDLESDSRTEENQANQPVVIKSASGKPEYRVYESPDVATKVVYIASEDENFQVVEELARWYRIVLPDGTTGWLQKSNVKAVE